MDSIDVSTLDPDQKIDISLAKLALERVVSKVIFGSMDVRIGPSVRELGMILATVFSFCLSTIRAPGTLENIIHRIEGIPRYIDELLARLDKPIARWVSIDIEKVEGLHDFSIRWPNGRPPLMTVFTNDFVAPSVQRKGPSIVIVMHSNKWRCRMILASVTTRPPSMSSCEG